MSAPGLTLERLLVHPKAFGLTTASPVQRGICRIADGLPLGELAEHPDVLAAVGDVASLPSVRPAELHVLAGIRSGKSLIAAALAVRASQTCDLSRLGPGETARVSVLSLTVDLARVVYQHLTGNLLAKPALRALLVEEPTADSVMLRHPSGAAVEVKVVAGARAGASIVARWSAGVIFDEAPRMNGEEDGVVNFDDARRAALGRLLPGAQIVAVGSPWAPRGPVYDAVTEHWGKPSADLVIVRATGPQMNPSWWTPERVEATRRRDATTYRCDVLCEFAERETSFFEGTSIDAAIDASLMLPRKALPAEEVTAGGDLGFRNDSSALAVVHRDATTYRVADVLELRPMAGVPLKPGETVATFAARLLAHEGLQHLVADGHYRESVAEHLAEHDLSFKAAPAGAEGVASVYVKARSLFREGRVRIPNHPRLIAQLRAVRWRPNPSGSISIILPREAGGGHCDLVSALVLALWEACGLPVPQPAPKPNSPEYYAQLEAEALASAERAFERSRNPTAWSEREDWGVTPGSYGDN